MKSSNTPENIADKDALDRHRLTANLLAPAVPIQKPVITAKTKKVVP